MTYFVESICGTASTLSVPESSERAIYRVLNSENRPVRCAANKILRNASGDVIAIRCNCAKKTYHPATEGKVFWSSVFSKKEIRMFRSKSIRTEKLLAITEDF